MNEDGYHNITDIDLSANVAKQMAEAYRERCPSLEYRHMDVFNLHLYYKRGEFNAVIDKATFDDIECGDGAELNLKRMIQMIYRVLAPNGVYICISHGIPSERLHYFQSDGDAA